MYTAPLFYRNFGRQFSLELSFDIKQNKCAMVILDVSLGVCIMDWGVCFFLLPHACRTDFLRLLFPFGSCGGSRGMVWIEIPVSAMGLVLEKGVGCGTGFGRGRLGYWSSRGVRP